MVVITPERLGYLVRDDAEGSTLIRKPQNASADFLLRARDPCVSGQAGIERQ